jgi:AcrR family transcriptional regulator
VILDTAGRLFAVSGTRTSLKQVADACGILPGSLYHHFDSKEAILVELIQRYQAELDDIADRALTRPAPATHQELREQIVAVGNAIAGCAVRHRAAVLLTFYDPPTTGDDPPARRSGPLLVEAAMFELLAAGRERSWIRPSIDLAAFSARLCQSMTNISLGAFQDVRSADELAALRCRILLDGVATRPPSDRSLDGSDALRAAQQVIDSWDDAGSEEDERLAKLDAVARSQFGRRGFETTTIRDIAEAAGVPIGSIYRSVRSKDDLLARIMRSLSTRVGTVWDAVLGSDAGCVEKLDALMWTNINVIDRFGDECNAHLDLLRGLPAGLADRVECNDLYPVFVISVASTFAACLQGLKALQTEGLRSGELRVHGRTGGLRTWSLFDPLWLHENVVRRMGPRDALALARDTVLRGAATS